MTRVRMFVCAAAGLTLAAVAWSLPSLEAQAVVTSPAVLSRWFGVALLGVAMVAAGLVFRSAMTAPKTPVAPPVHRRTSEFRRGFALRDRAAGDAGARGTPRLPSRQPVASRPPKRAFLTEDEVVVALRRAVAEEAEKPQPQPGTLLPVGEVERLQDLLHSRAAELRARNAEQAQRRFMRSGIDLHGLAHQ